MQYFAVGKTWLRKLFPKKTETDFPTPYISNRFFVDRINAEPILIIGDYTNREYDSLLSRFKEVYSSDILDIQGVRDGYFIKQSVEDRFPFPDGFFKFIILGEVIECIWRDREALLELNRLLSPSGTLLMSLQFYSKVKHNRHIYFPAGHIYSPDSIIRLLKYSDFEPVEMKYFGLAKFFGAKFVGVLALMLYPFYGQKGLEVANRFVYSLFEQ